MTAIAWSLVGLMAASLGVLSAALFSGMGRFDAMDARFDAMHGRIDTLGSELRAEIRDLRGEMHQLG